MSNLFIKREVKVDGMPKSEGWLFVLCDFPIADAVMQVAWFDKEGGFTVAGVTHYLEPVSLPTEEEAAIEMIARYSTAKGKGFKYSGLLKEGFADCYNWLLSRLTNTNQS